MKPVYLLCLLLFCVVPARIFSQQPHNANCHSAFSADSVYTCNDRLQVQFADESIIPEGDTVVKKTWKLGDGTVSYENAPRHYYARPGIYTVSFKIETSSGWSDSLTRQAYIHVAGTIVNLGPDTAICDGSSLLLDAGNPGANYIWSNGMTTASQWVMDPGKYWVQVEKNGCFSSDTILVKLNPSLLPKFGYTFLGTCVPMEVQFRDSSLVCGVSIIRWAWDFGDGSTSGLQHPKHLYTDTGEYMVRLTIYDNTGNSITRSKKLLVRSQDLVVQLGKDTSFCFGNMFTLNAGFPGATYLWSTGETTQQIQVMDDGEYSVEVRMGGCKGRDTIKLATIFPLTPEWAYAISGKCLPVAVSFSDKSFTRCQQSIVKWRWDFGDGQESSLQHPTHEYLRSDSFLIRLTVTTSEGISVSKARKIFIENTTPVMDAGPDKFVCANSAVTLDAGIDQAQYKWTPSGLLDYDSIRKPTATVRENTLFKVAVTQCMVTITDSVWVKVAAAPAPVITKEDQKLRSTPAFGYQWYRNDRKINNANSRIYKPESAGYYTVKVKNQLGCESVSAPYFFLPKGKHHHGFRGIHIKCTPNPGNGRFQLLLSELPEKPMQLRVLDRFGQVIYRAQVVNYVTAIDISQRAKGVYMIELRMEDDRVTIPLILQ